MSAAVALPAVITSSGARKSRAKRCLFAQTEDSAWCERLLEQKLEEKTREWEFDFAHGVPLPSSSRFEYTELSPEAVPHFYRACSFDRRQSTSSETSSDQENCDPVLEDMDTSLELDQTCARAMAPVDRKKAVRTPKKSAAAAQQHQRKVTEFMSVRKRQRVSIVKKVAAGAGVGALTSPRRTPAHASSR